MDYLRRTRVLFRPAVQVVPTGSIVIAFDPQPVLTLYMLLFKQEPNPCAAAAKQERCLVLSSSHSPAA